MNKLYIDTSTSDLALAVEANRKVFSFNQPAKKKMAEMLFVELENLLHQAFIKLSDIDVVYTTIGPGSYTGARIGLNVAKVLKILKPELQVKTVSSLKALLAATGDKSISLIDARNKAFFALTSDQQEGEEKRIELEEALELIEKGYHPVIYRTDEEAENLLKRYSTLIKTTALESMIIKEDIFKTVDDVNSLKPFYLKDQKNG